MQINLCENEQLHWTQALIILQQTSLLVLTTIPIDVNMPDLQNLNDNEKLIIIYFLEPN